MREGEDAVRCVEGVRVAEEDDVDEGEETSSSGFEVVFGTPPATFLRQWARARGEGSQR